MTDNYEKCSQCAELSATARAIADEDWEPPRCLRHDKTFSDLLWPPKNEKKENLPIQPMSGKNLDFVQDEDIRTVLYSLSKGIDNAVFADDADDFNDTISVIFAEKLGTVSSLIRGLTPKQRGVVQYALTMLVDNAELSTDVDSAEEAIRAIYNTGWD